MNYYMSMETYSRIELGQDKMSKSDPDSAIFMEDSVEDVNRKIKKAFCPEKVHLLHSFRVYFHIFSTRLECIF